MVKNPIRLKTTVLTPTEPPEDLILTLLPCCLPSAEMEASNQQGFQDPLSAAAAESERMSALSLDKPAGREASATTDSPTPSINRQTPDGNEGTEAVDLDRNDATDSSSTWSPEVLQPDI